MPKVSVIIPAHNCAAFVAAAIESVKAQTFPDWEIVLVDDGSTDETAEAIRPYAADGVVRYFRQGNAGPASARNNAMRNARGAYLVLLDADDLLLPDCVGELVSLLDEQGDVGFAFPNYEIVDARGVVAASGVDTWKRFRAIPHEQSGDRWRFNGRLARAIIEYGGFMSTSGIVIRAALLEAAGGFREGYFYGEDDEFYARLTSRCASAYVDRVLVRVRNRGDGLRFDRAQATRNARNLVELAEEQVRYFQGDPEMLAILARKIPGLVYDLCWGLQQRGEYEAARDILLRYLPRCRSWPLFKLLARDGLMRLGLATRPGG